MQPCARDIRRRCGHVKCNETCGNRRGNCWSAFLMRDETVFSPTRTRTEVSIFGTRGDLLRVTFYFWEGHSVRLIGNRALCSHVHFDLHIHPEPPS
jgi:hypothetical protein